MSRRQGGCHCGKVRFEVALDGPGGDLYRCNCSLCRRKAIIMMPMPKEAFALTAGAGNLAVYQWNKNIAAHYFCTSCGVYTHHRRRSDPSQIAINYACLDGVETPAESVIGLIDGASLD